MADFNYRLTFAGVPFVLDTARLYRMPGHVPYGEVAEQLPPRKQQPEFDLLDEVNRLLAFKYLNDFAVPGDFPGRNVAALAKKRPLGPMPSPEVRVGDWYYPYGASRWSVFRGLATSIQVRAMLDATAGRAPATFVMQAAPVSPDNPAGLPNLYTLSTPMYMLPVRPLAEHGSQFDGLYLVTLVDERYYWQYASTTLHVTKDTTWSSLIQQLCAAVGVTFLSFTQPDYYYRPEPDSQFWVNQENVAVLMDAAANCLGSVWVRNLQRQYNLYQYPFSRRVASANRGNVNLLIRAAGGDIFQSGTVTRAGDLTAAMNSVLPTHVGVTFPKYVEGDDPVPHFLNPRYQNQRPSCWYEESYGDVHLVTVPLLSGGLQFSGQLGFFISGSAQLGNGGSPYISSGLTGTSGFTPTVATAAKAIYSGEAQAVSGGDPVNASGLRTTAMQVASDYFNAQIAAALDEVYPGTYAWEPEGIHDIVWTYSSRSRGAFTRVMRTQWNQEANESQQSAHPLPESTNVPRGVGGPSVAQTWRDQVSGDITAKLAQTMLSGATAAVLTNVNYLPTDNRWRGRIDNEVILFEGTSGGALDEGGAPISTAVDVVHRGVDGTLQVEHANLSDVRQVLPDVNYGTNLVTHGPMQWVFPKAWTSGGVQEAQVVPQTQTVQVLDSSGVDINGVIHRSGVLMHYRTDLNNSFVEAEPIWVIERNDGDLKDNVLYDGQFVGYSAQASGLSASGAAESGAISGNYLTFPSAPTYAVNNLIASSGQIFSSGSVYYIFYNNHFYYNTNIFYGSGTVIYYINSYPVYNYFTENNFNGGVYDPGFWPKIRFVPPLNNTFLVDGFRGGQAGRMLIVWNAGEGGVRLLNDAADPASDSVCVPMSEATSYNIPPRDGVILEYDGESKCWRFDHPSFGTGPAAVGSPQCYATRYMRFASGISYTVANEVNGVVDIGPGLVVKNSAGTTTVENVHTIIFDSQLADFLVTGDGDGTATISQAGLTVTKTVVTNVTCDNGVLQVYRENWVFKRGRLVLVS